MADLQRLKRGVEIRSPKKKRNLQNDTRIKACSRVTASCWCLAGTRVSVLSVLTPWPLCQMAVRCVVHLLTRLCVYIFDVYLANCRKTLLEFCPSFSSPAFSRPRNFAQCLLKCCPSFSSPAFSRPRNFAKSLLKFCPSFSSPAFSGRAFSVMGFFIGPYGRCKNFLLMN